MPAPYLTAMLRSAEFRNLIHACRELLQKAASAQEAREAGTDEEDEVDEVDSAPETKRKKKKVSFVYKDDSVSSSSSSNVHEASKA